MRLNKESWLAAYLRFTEGQESPELFHLWTGIAVVATALGRNVWVDRRQYKIYPNHYIVLVAPSALCRKSTSVRMGVGLLEAARVVDISAERITNASLWEQLGKLSKEKGAAELLIFADELRTFLSSEETHKGVITTLTRLYTCPDFLENRTKTAGVDHLVNCCVNLLAATTPADFVDILPLSAIGSGFGPRLHIVFQSIPRPRRAILTRDAQMAERLIADLKEVRKLKGEYSFSKEALSWWVDWYENKMEVPDEELLDGVYGRKHDSVLKLGMVLAASARDSLVLEKSDLTMALSFLDQIEAFMPKAYEGIGAMSPVTKYADIVLRQIAKHRVLGRRKLLHLNWRRFDPEELSAICRYLEEAGRIEVLPSPQGRGTVYKYRREILNANNGL